MKIGITTWDHRISPVCDVAEFLLVVELTEIWQEIGREIVPLNCGQNGIYECGQRLVNLDIDVLICGAISNQLRMFLISLGIEVIAEVCGSCDEVIACYQSGAELPSCFSMPGCNRHRRGRRGRGWRGNGADRNFNR